jgi:hypothetical protein
LVEGIVTDGAGRPVKDARVYVYKWFFDEETIDTIIQDEEGEREESTHDYGAYRGPADFKSAKTGPEGKYRIPLPPGTYCLVARKRFNQDIPQGPFNPEDASSLVSEPVPVEPNETARISLMLLDTLRDAAFFDRYLVRTYRTGVSGRVLSAEGKPVSGVIVTANEKGNKIGRRPEFFSFPTDKEGNYRLYVYYGGVYFLGIQRQPSGGEWPRPVENDSGKREILITQGRILSGMDLTVDK